MDKVIKILEEIQKIEKNQILIAIDGRCASGKTTLSKQLQEKLNCSVIHMDDFFLQPHQQTEERYNQAGGNIDYERFLEEVLEPLIHTHKCQYQVYDCQIRKMVDQISVDSSIIIIEGSYSCHPKFQKYCDLKVFLDIDPTQQLSRLKKRNLDKLGMFIQRWIPLEEKYIQELQIRQNCNLVFNEKKHYNEEKKVGKNMKSKVYFTKDITPQSMIKMYEALGVELKGKVGVKVHSGEVGNQNFIRPKFMEDIIHHVNGTIVECNTAYEGKRNTTKEHWETMKLHGWTNVADVDILDEDGEDELKVENGKQIQVNYVGSHMKNYDSLLVLSHFKGHPMGGFGGALKNISIGLASSHGKAYIHGAGDEEKIWSSDHDSFLEAMADASQSIMNEYKGKIAFINVMKNMSVDCDCCAVAEDPKVKDIGILASLDPVALDQACLDKVYNSDDPNKNHLIERIESRNGIHTVEAAAELKVGSREYELIEIKTIQF